MAAPLIVAALLNGIDAVAMIEVAQGTQPATEASMALGCLTANEAPPSPIVARGSFTFTIAFRFPSAATATGATTSTATAAFASDGDT